MALAEISRCTSGAPAWRCAAEGVAGVGGVSVDATVLLTAAESDGCPRGAPRPARRDCARVSRGAAGVAERDTIGAAGWAAAAGRALGRNGSPGLAIGAALAVGPATVPVELVVDVTLVAGRVLRWTAGAANSRGAVVSPTAGLTVSALGTALTWRAKGKGGWAGPRDDGEEGAAPPTAAVVLGNAVVTPGRLKVVEAVRVGAGRGVEVDRWAAATGVLAGWAVGAGAAASAGAGGALKAGAPSSGQA